MYSTMSPLNNDDRDEIGNLLTHYIPIYRSQDLVHWEYQGDVFTSPPEWANRGAALYAPEIQYFNSKYYLYYTVTNTVSPRRQRNCSRHQLQPDGPFRRCR
jgi:arabinan endo-1,5-alpha-L-arabinosidase